MKMREKFYKRVAWITLISIVFQTIYPTVALAGGPSQKESSEFTPSSATDLVNLFTGDFTYNIPVLNIGGYPINLAYNSGAGIEEDASWVGLGWSLNPGSITRAVRGLPDDFSGDEIKKDFHVSDNNTFGFNSGASVEIVGFDIGAAAGLSVGVGVNYNNRNGIGFETNFGPSFGIGRNNRVGMNANLGMSNSTMNGFGVNPSLSLSSTTEEGGKSFSRGIGMGMGYNSVQGVKSLNFYTTASSSPESTSNNKEIAWGKFREGTRNEIGNFSGSYSFASPAVSPPSELPIESFNFAINCKAGLAFSLAFASGDVGGYFSSQYLSSNSQTIPAYGYMYSQNSHNDEDMHDFNREKDDAFVKGTKALPIPNYTYDVFSVTGQGINGSYRPHRGDIPRLHEKKNDISGDGMGGTGSIEGGVGPGGWHVGGNATVSWTSSYTGDWQEGRANFTKYGAKKKVTPKHEPYYFRALGENTVNQNQGLINALGGDSAVRMQLASPTELNHKFITPGGREIAPPTATYKAEREVRSQLFSTLNAEEASKFGVVRTVKSYTPNDESKIYTPEDYVNVPRLDSERKSHHMSEVTVKKSDGFLYVYGIPAYNTNQNEYSFATDEKDDDANGAKDGLVPVRDTIVTNKKGEGRDKYFMKTNTPGYAHSFLLNCVLSPDYRDSDGIEGPSEGDIGNYVLFNYSRVSNSFDWRMPAQDGMAYFSEGMIDDDYDNKANFTEGKKELWYLHSIESKDDIALFYLEDRRDSKSISGKTLKQLNRIAVYPKQELRNYTSYGTHPTATKEVHFKYAENNPLCKGFPNSNGKGKLTLEELWFTYGNSRRGALNKYDFGYGKNPDYSASSKDRWGVYKPNVSSHPNTEYPYAIQDEDDANENAKSWNLSKIILPTGGSIHVDYEADSYSYTQDNRTMNLYNVVGVGNDKDNDNPTTVEISPDPGDEITDRNLYDEGKKDNSSDINYYVYFELDSSVKDTIQSRGWASVSNELLGSTELAANQYVREQYAIDKGGLSANKLTNDLTNNGFMKFRFKIKLRYDQEYENVPGYAQIEEIGVAKKNANYGYVKLVSEKLSGKTKKVANPISKVAWNFMRLYQPKLVNNSALAKKADKINDPKSSSGEKVDALLNAMGELVTLDGVFEGLQDLISGIEYNRYFPDGFGHKYKKEGSWIRLYKPGKTKIGGGHRVSRIEFKDNWSALSGSDSETNVVTGFEYDYTMKEGDNTISSGIASYEPGVGGEVNPFKQPEMHTENKVFAPSTQYVKERPFGESFFPSASIGYQKVTVSSINASTSRKHGVGTAVHEFYTWKDYPVKTSHTEAKYTEYDKGAFDAILDFFDIKSVTEYTASQGVAVELNNMHGKQKKTSFYREGADAEFSSVEYIYKETPNGDLDNDVLVIDKDQVITKAKVGVDYDFVMDFRENTSISHTTGAQLNTDGQVYLFFPVVTVMVIPIYSYEKVQFRGATTSKVINKAGILQKTIVKDENAITSTKNELYDAITGGVLLTSVNNEFDQPVYNFKRPAFWDYDEMGLAYENEGMEFDGNVTDGFFTSASPGATTYFSPGDVVYINDVLAWYAETDDGMRFIDVSGSLVTEDNAHIKIIRSGKSNQLSVFTQSVSMLDNPVLHNGNNSYTFSPFSNVLNAQAITLSDNWQLNCDCGYVEGTSNPYLYGAKGTWRQKSTWAYLDDRKQTFSGGRSASDVRTDGAYTGGFTSFESVYDVSAGTAAHPWKEAERIMNYNKAGQVVEKRNANLISSANSFGYGGTKSTGTVANASSHEIGFDSFEDYNFSDCDGENSGHFTFKDAVSNYVQNDNIFLALKRWFTPKSSSVKEGVSHSGKTSLKVPSGEGVKMKVRLIENYRN